MMRQVGKSGVVVPVKDWREMWDDPKVSHPRTAKVEELKLAARMLRARWGELGWAVANRLESIAWKAEELDKLFPESR
jgi:hypothetical protein